MSSKVINGTLVQFIDEKGETSAILVDGNIVKRCPRDLETHMIKEWNAEQRRINKRERAKSFNNKNTEYVRVNLNKVKDKDIRDHLNNLEIPKAQYIKELIRADMSRYNKKGG